MRATTVFGPPVAQRRCGRCYHRRCRALSRSPDTRQATISGYDPGEPAIPATSVHPMNAEPIASKVPAVTLTFWIIKIAATTLGETGGDTVSMTLGLGYVIGTAIFLTALIVLVAWQMRVGDDHRGLHRDLHCAVAAAGRHAPAGPRIARTDRAPGESVAGVAERVGFEPTNTR